MIDEQRSDSLRLELSNGATPAQVLEMAIQKGPGPIKRFEIVEPTLQEIFLEAVGKADPDAIEQLREEGIHTGKLLTEG